MKSPIDHRLFAKNENYLHATEQLALAYGRSTGDPRHIGIDKTDGQRPLTDLP